MDLWSMVMVWILEMDGSAKLSSGSMDVGQWLLVNGYPMDTL